MEVWRIALPLSFPFKYPGNWDSSLEDHNTPSQLWKILLSKNTPAPPRLRGSNRPNPSQDVFLQLSWDPW
ncbi:uncharacterized protein BCR38DRAFT_426531 [Pseudomassariella vexata]|uniref:Uncharacterized protein n=1 Tax=Pseudomassariella vexata TaxID=1141098 RepID=A0A1Y2E6X9_9PEZI|nr:uncharacterized protein BCR38DRAFT_426531 [Pseudomassariella vexata]ORY67269.1 hypothetical protein BCR38DRAFT_426531 [Pseudomassariella vexata]